MAEVMTFTSLWEELADAFERGQNEVDDEVVYQNRGRIINRAERRIAYDLKVQGYETTAIAAFTINSPVVSKPGNWLRTVSINFGSGSGNNTRNFLFPRAYEFLRTVYPNDTTTGTPRFYADYDLENWLIAPTPSAASPFEVKYYGLPELLDDANQSNWLTEVVPHILFAACGVELSMFLKDDNRAAGLLNIYKESLGALAREDVQKITDRSAKRASA